MDEKQEAKGGKDIIAPLIEVGRGEALVPWLLPGFDMAQLHWHRVSPRVVLRIFLKGVLATIGVLALAAPLIGLWSLLALTILPISWLVGFLSFHNLAYARAADHLPSAGASPAAIGRSCRSARCRQPCFVPVRSSASWAWPA